MPVTTKNDGTSVCTTCGELGDGETEWVDCWNGCHDGFHDGYEEDPLWYDDGDMIRCDVCNGKGGWLQCLRCEAKEEEGTVE